MYFIKNFSTFSTGESYRGLAECWVADKGAFLVVRFHVIIQKVCGRNIWLHAKDSFVNFEKGNRIIAANVYICTGEDFISLQLVSYPFALFCMTIKYVYSIAARKKLILSFLPISKFFFQWHSNVTDPVDSSLLSFLSL
jgi:hypothetical protein